MIIKVKLEKAGVSFNDAIDAITNELTEWTRKGYEITSDINVAQRTYRSHWRWVATAQVSTRKAK